MSEKFSLGHLEVARALLANPDIGVTQIAHRLGVSPGVRVGRVLALPARAGGLVHVQVGDRVGGFGGEALSRA